MKPSEFQKRIGYEGELEKVVSKVAEDFDLGKYSMYRVIEAGYEDLNVVITTDKGKYFVKMLATFRDNEGCKRYVDIMLTALEAGVSHPRLLQSPQGYLYKNVFDGRQIRLVVMEHINGKSLYDSKEEVSLEDARFLIQQAADIKSLPTAFVHGDIIRTNVMRDENGKFYILDFSVANIYPRIQELAVLLCNILYDDKNPGAFMDYYELALDEYKKKNELTKPEIETLPLYLKAAHAMHIIGAGREKYKKDNKSEENEYWLSKGRNGLRDMNRLF